MATKRSAKSPRVVSESTDRQRHTLMGEGNARQRPEFTARLEKAHKEICAAYRLALIQTRCSQAQAARGMVVTSNTAANYEHGRTPVNVARVLAYPRISKAFRDALCSYDHGHNSAPYIAKKAKR